MTIAKQVQFLKLYSLLLTCFVIWLGWRMETSSTKKSQTLAELTVERINIVEPDGKLKMVLSNRQRQHPGLINGKSVPARERDAGLLFFNSSGDECGGLVYDGTAEHADLSFSVDQFRGDQVLQLQYEQEATVHGPVKSYGLKLWDRPENPTLSQQQDLVDSLKKALDPAGFKKAITQLKAAGHFGRDRLFVGRTKQQEVGIFIQDKEGTPRIKLYVDANNKAMLEMLDQNGRADQFSSKQITNTN